MAQVEMKIIIDENGGLSVSGFPKNLFITMGIMDAACDVLRQHFKNSGKEGGQIIVPKGVKFIGKNGS